MHRLIPLSLLALLSFTSSTGCKPSSSTASQAARSGAAGPVTLNGAGSTFVYPMMSRWSSEYQKLAPDVHVNYQSIGSGGGIRQLIARTVQFGATDGPMTDQQLEEARSPVLHVPLVMGAVVPTYNLPAVTRPIRFTPEALAGIFLGEITKWDDARITSVNSGVELPGTSILVVHRSDGSGTTYVWADYLSKVSPTWKAKVGTATSLDWPAGIGGKGNEGVAGTVRQTPGAIGYVELTYAKQNKMPVGLVKNRAGKFVEPTIESITAAAAGAQSSIPDDLRYSITDSPAADGYPICGTTWAVVYRDMPAGADRSAMTGFLRWVLGEGQKFCAPLDYAPLPAELVKRAEAKLDLVERAAK